jgi:DNA polymerase-3 subunit gamma/tau
MKWAPNKKLHFEIAIIKAVQTLEQATLSEILDALAAIRSGGELPVRLSGGNAGSGEKATPPPSAPRKRLLEMPGVEATPVATPAAKPVKPEGSSASAAALPPEPAPIVSETPETASPADLLAPAAVVDVNALWTDALIAVRRERPLISTWLEAGALLEVTGNAVRVGFPPEQKMAMESLLRVNNRGFLEKLFTQLTGEARVIECETREGLVVQPANIPAPAPEPPPADPMDEFKNDPLIRKALEIFQAEIQPA